MAALPSWLFPVSREPDGQSAALAGLVTGVSPGSLEAGLAVPAVELSKTAIALGAGRRDRPLAFGERVVRDALASKVLLGWLQNRHQTLVPLSLNLRTLAPSQADILARWLAVVLLSGRGGQAGQARDWLATLGADEPFRAALDRALAAPGPIHAVLAELAAQDLGAHGFVLALLGLDGRDAATGPFLDYVAARLNLPTTVIRSAMRRYSH